MRKLPYAVINKICLQCQQPLTTTSTREKVHAACRAEYYAHYHRKNYQSKKMNAYVALRERARYFDGPCEACGYIHLTKARRFFHAEPGEVKEHRLCPNCLALWRCGRLEALTWKSI